MDSSIATTALWITEHCRNLISECVPNKNIDVGFDNYIFNIAPIFEKQLKRVTNDKSEISTQTVMCLVTDYWRKNKTIYDFSPSFLTELEKTEDAPVYTSILKKLPFTDYIMTIPSSTQKYNAMFVHIEFDGTDTLFLVCPFEASKNPEHSSYCQCSIWCKDGKNVIETFKETYGEKTANYERFLKLAIAASYYLASKNAEINKIQIPKDKRPTIITNRTKRPKRVNINSFAVGYKTGKRFETQVAYSNSQTNSTKAEYAISCKNKRPHVRRAHWHHYWTGEGRKNLEVRWIEPVFVLGTEASNAVSHRVTGLV